MAMEQIGTSLIAVVLVMASVFIPAAFLPGTTGQLYKQFAITIVISVAISGFVALTLTPAMCGILLKHSTPTQTGIMGYVNRFFAWFNRGFDRFTAGFGDAGGAHDQADDHRLYHPWLSDLWARAPLPHDPDSFVPNEDQGYVMAQLIMPDAASLNRTSQTSSRVDELFAKNPAVANRTIINGYSLIDAQYKPNVATFFVTFKDFEERYSSKERARKESAEAVLGEVAAGARAIETGRFIPIVPPAIPGIGTTGGFEFWIQDKGAGDPARLYEITQQFLAKARTRPELTGLNTTFRAASQQLRAEVDRSKAVLLGVPVDDVYSALQAQFGSIQVSQFNQYSRVWNVILQSDAPYRRTPARHHQALHEVHRGQDGSAVGPGDDQVRDRPGPGAAFQRVPRSPGHRWRGAGVQLGRRDQGDGGGRERGASLTGMVSPGQAWPTRKRNPGVPPRTPSSSASSSSSSCWLPSSSRGSCPAPS